MQDLLGEFVGTAKATSWAYMVTHESLHIYDSILTSIAGLSSYNWTAYGVYVQDDIKPLFSRPNRSGQ
jgi:hypothetical protein